MAEKQRKRQGIVNSTKLPFRHFQGKDLSKFRRIPAEFRHLEEKERKRKGKETDRRFWNHSITSLLCTVKIRVVVQYFNRELN